MRSIYFLEYAPTNTEVVQAFLSYVNFNKVKKVGRKDSYRGFIVDYVTGKPIVKNLGKTLQVSYGVEKVRAVTRLNGEREVYHIKRINELSLDPEKRLVGLYTHDEDFAQFLFEDLLKKFAQPNDIDLKRITYDSGFIHWLSKNAKTNSTLFVSMKRVKAEKDSESGIIFHENDIEEAELFGTIDTWKEFLFVEGDFKVADPEEPWAKVRVYDSGKLTIRHTRPYEVAQSARVELLRLHGIYETK